MFTGLVEELGELTRISRTSTGIVLTIKCKDILEDLSLGDSIATNGVCLTVTSFTDSEFTADCMIVTAEKTGLTELREGSKINLERALRLGDRLGGHLLQGHVDTVGTVRNRIDDHVQFLLEVGVDPSFGKYMIDQGSIGLNGVSLTIVEAKADSFIVSLIPETLMRTNIMDLMPGDQCTVEFDIFGKYINRQLELEEDNSTEITESFLLEHGF